MFGEITEKWIEDYNERRPHDSLKGLPPMMYREMITREVSLYEVSSLREAYDAYQVFND